MDSKGFNLIEVLVVVAVVSILGSYALASYDSFITNNQMTNLSHRIVQAFKRASSLAVANNSLTTLNISTYIEPLGSGLVAKGWFVFQTWQLDANGFLVPENETQTISFSGSDTDSTHLTNENLTNEFSKARVYFDNLANCRELQAATINSPRPDSCDTVTLNASGSISSASVTNNIEMFLCAPDYDNEPIRNITVNTRGLTTSRRVDRDSTEGVATYSRLRSLPGQVGACFR